MLYSSFLFIHFNISLQGFQWFLLVNGEKKWYNDLIYGKRRVQAVENPRLYHPFFSEKHPDDPWSSLRMPFQRERGKPPASPPPNS